MNFLIPVRATASSVLDASSAVPAASVEVLSHMRRGRTAIGISAVSKDVYIGGEDVTASTGMPVKAGESIVIPVGSDAVAPFYVVGGSCIITEFF
ncbi:MAG: hypothetical protein LUG91_08990 [Ruminococcus sp.]|nr:hypothetical protein [Ruminococcus sp.]